MTMSANPSIVSPSPWMTVAERRGVHRSTSRAQFVLTTFGHDHQQRVGVGGLGGEQRLRGLAQAGLVGEQERAVAGRGGGDHLRLVGHQLQPVGHASRAAGLGQGHAGDGPGARVLEGAQQRAEQLPAGQPLRADLRRAGGVQVGGEERVGQLAGDDRLRHDLALGRRGRPRRGRLGLLGATSTPADSSSSRRRRLPDSESSESSAISASSEVSRAAVFARIVATPSRRLSCVALNASVVVASAFTRARSSRTSRATTWNFVRTEGRVGPAGDLGLHLAHGPGEHGDDALVVALSATSLGTWGATAGSRLALASSSHSTSLRAGRA